jgi:hypothetical protein
MKGGNRVLSWYTGQGQLHANRTTTATRPFWRQSSSAALAISRPFEAAQIITPSAPWRRPFINCRGEFSAGGADIVRTEFAGQDALGRDGVGTIAGTGSAQDLHASWPGGPNHDNERFAERGHELADTLHAMALA